MAKNINAEKIEFTNLSVGTSVDHLLGILLGEPTRILTSSLPFSATSHTHPWSEITATPTTLSGYGITDAQPLDADLTAIAGLVGTTGFLIKTAANTWSLDTSTYLTTETDPVFIASPAGGIIVGDITNWNTAFGWGDHAVVGYALDSNVVHKTGIETVNGEKTFTENLTVTASVGIAGSVFAASLQFNAANPVILSNDTDGRLSIGSSNAINLGAEIRMYGELHATKANDIEFLNNNVVKGSWDSSASLWSFVGNISAINLSGTNTGDVTLAGALDYITISGQVITRNAIDLTTDITGDLPLSNLAQQSAFSVLGRAGSGVGDVASITAGNDTILSRSGVGDVAFNSATTVRGILSVYSQAEITSILAGYSLTSHNHTLDSLSNVTITANSSGELLKWNGSAWINNTLAEAGISAVGHTHTFASLTSIPTTIAGYGITDFNSLGDARWLGISNTAANSTLLDSIDSTQFLRSDVADNKTSGNLTFNDTVAIDFGHTTLRSRLRELSTNTVWDLFSGDLIVRNSGTDRFTFARTTGNFTATGNGIFRGSTLEVGQSDNTQSTIIANGAPTAGGTSGGALWLRLAADHDSVIDMFQITAVADDFQFGSNLTPALLKYDGSNNQWIFNHGGNVSIGNTNNTYKLDVTGTGRFTGDHTANDHINTSDIRLKSNIHDLKTNVSVHDVNLKSYVKNGRIEWGVIAQELREVLPHAVIGDESKDMLAVSYNQLLMLAIKDIQSQDERLKRLEEIVLNLI